MLVRTGKCHSGRQEKFWPAAGSGGTKWRGEILACLAKSPHWSAACLHYIGSMVSSNRLLLLIRELLGVGGCGYRQSRPTCVTAFTNPISSSQIVPCPLLHLTSQLLLRSVLSCPFTGPCITSRLSWLGSCCIVDEHFTIPAGLLIIGCASCRYQSLPCLPDPCPALSTMCFPLNKDRARFVLHLSAHTAQ